MIHLRVAIAKKQLQVIRNSFNIITMPSNNLQWYISGTHITHGTTLSACQKTQGLLWTCHTCQLLNLVHTEMQKALIPCGMMKHRNLIITIILSKDKLLIAPILIIVLILHH